MGRPDVVTVRSMENHADMASSRGGNKCGENRPDVYDTSLETTFSNFQLSP